MDEYFKTGLTSPEVSEVDEDWARMKVILQKNKRSRKLISSLLATSSVAAVLLIVFALLPGKKEIAGDAHPAGLSPGKENAHLPVISRAPAEQLKAPVLNRQEVPERSGQLTAQSPALGMANEAAGREVVYTGADTNLPPAETERVDTGENDQAEAVVLPGRPIVNRDTIPAGHRSDEDRRVPVLSGSRFSLAFMLSPDLSGVNNLRKAGIGYGVGAGIIYRLSDKLDIETGLSYGVKVYHTDFSSYKPNSSYVFPEKPYEVNADCEVIDLQLNIAYRLLDRGTYNIGVKAGISSYTMLHENYRFKYEHNYARGPRKYDLNNENRHYPGVANLSLSYRRKLSDQLSLAFDPYLKLPLTDIGYGNVRLKSAGINIGVITNLTNPGK